MTVGEWIPLLYLVSVVLFAVGIKRLSRVRTSRSGNGLAAAGMLLAVIGTLVEAGAVDLRWVPLGLGIGAAVGLLMVVRAKATQMPEIVARFNGFGGGASALVALSLFWHEIIEVGTTTTPAEVLGVSPSVTLALGILIGATTFSGSIVAELKLRGTLSGTPRIPARPVVMGALGVGGLVLAILALFTAATRAPVRRSSSACSR
jgi:H+-translocating NAD(P) transhydrogenase subunit beta